MRLGDGRLTPGGPRPSFLLSPALSRNVLGLPLTAVRCSSCCFCKCSSSLETAPPRSPPFCPVFSLRSAPDSHSNFAVLSSLEAAVHSCASCRLPCSVPRRVTSDSCLGAPCGSPSVSSSSNGFAYSRSISAPALRKIGGDGKLYEFYEGGKGGSSAPIRSWTQMGNACRRHGGQRRPRGSRGCSGKADASLSGERRSPFSADLLQISHSSLPCCCAKRCELRGSHAGRSPGSEHRAVRGAGDQSCSERSREEKVRSGEGKMPNATGSTEEGSNGSLVYLYCLTDSEAMKVLENTLPESPAFLMYVHPAGSTDAGGKRGQEGGRRCRSESFFVARKVGDPGDKRKTKRAEVGHISENDGTASRDTRTPERGSQAEGERSAKAALFEHRDRTLPSYVNVMYRCPVTRLSSTCSFWFPSLRFRSAAFCSPPARDALLSGRGGLRREEQLRVSSLVLDSPGLPESFPSRCLPTRRVSEDRGAVGGRDSKITRAGGDKLGCRARVDALVGLLHELQEALRFLYSSFLFSDRPRERVEEALPIETNPRACRVLEKRQGGASPRKMETGCPAEAEKSPGSSSFFVAESSSCYASRSLSLLVGGRIPSDFFSEDTLASLVRWVVLLLAAALDADYRRQLGKEEGLVCQEKFQTEAPDQECCWETTEEDEKVDTRDEECGGERFVAVVLLGLAVEENLPRFSRFVWLRWLRALRRRPDDWETAAILPLLLAGSDAFLRQLLAAAPLVFSPLSSCLSVIHARALAFVTSKSCIPTSPRAFSSSSSRPLRAGCAMLDRRDPGDASDPSQAVRRVAGTGTEHQPCRSSPASPASFRRAWATQRALLCVFDVLVSYAVDNLIPLAARQINLLSAWRGFGLAASSRRHVKSLPPVPCQFSSVSLPDATAVACQICSRQSCFCSFLSGCDSLCSAFSAWRGRWPTASAAPDLWETLDLLASIKKALPLSLALEFLLMPLASTSCSEESRSSAEPGQKENHGSERTGSPTHGRRGNEAEIVSDPPVNCETTADVGSRETESTPTRFSLEPIQKAVSAEPGFLRDRRGNDASSVQTVPLCAFYEALKPPMAAVRRRCNFRSTGVDHGSTVHFEETSAPVACFTQGSTCDDTLCMKYSLRTLAEHVRRLLFPEVPPTPRASRMPSLQGGAQIPRVSGDEKQVFFSQCQSCHIGATGEWTSNLLRNWEAGERDASACTWKWVVLYSKTRDLLARAPCPGTGSLQDRPRGCPAEEEKLAKEMQGGGRGAPAAFREVSGRVTGSASDAPKHGGPSADRTEGTLARGSGGAVKWLPRDPAVLRWRSRPGRGSVGEKSDGPLQAPLRLRRDHNDNLRATPPTRGRPFERSASTATAAAWHSKVRCLRLRQTCRGRSWPLGAESKCSCSNSRFTSTESEGSRTVASKAVCKWLDQGRRRREEWVRAGDAFLVLLTSSIERNVAELAEALFPAFSSRSSSRASALRPSCLVAVSCADGGSSCASPPRCSRCLFGRWSSERSVVLPYRSLSTLLQIAASYVQCAGGGSSSVAAAAVRMLHASLSRLSSCLLKRPSVASNNEGEEICLSSRIHISLASAFFGLVSSFFSLVSTLLRALAFSPSYLSFVFRLLGLLCLLPEASPYRQRQPVPSQPLHVSRHDRVCDDSKCGFARNSYAAGQPQQLPSNRASTVGAASPVNLSRGAAPCTRNRSLSDAMDTGVCSGAGARSHGRRPSPSSKSWESFDLCPSGRASSPRRAVRPRPGCFSSRALSGAAVTAKTGRRGVAYSVSSLICLCFSEPPATLLREGITLWANSRDPGGGDRAASESRHCNGSNTSSRCERGRGSDNRPDDWRPLSDGGLHDRPSKRHALFMESLSASLHEARMNAARLLEALMLLVAESCTGEGARLTQRSNVRRKDSVIRRKGMFYGMGRHAELQERDAGVSDGSLADAGSPLSRHRLGFSGGESATQEPDVFKQTSRADQEEQQTEEANWQSYAGTGTSSWSGDDSVPFFWSTKVKKERMYMQAAVAPFLMDWMRFFFEPPMGIFHSFVRTSQQQLLPPAPSPPHSRSAPGSSFLAPFSSARSVVRPVLSPRSLSPCSPSLVTSPNSRSIQYSRLRREAHAAHACSHCGGASPLPSWSATVYRPHPAEPTCVQCGACLDCTATTNEKLALGNPPAALPTNWLGSPPPPSTPGDVGVQSHPISVEDAHREPARRGSEDVPHQGANTIRAKELLLQLLVTEQALLILPTSVSSPYASGSMLVMFVDLHYLGFLVSYCCNGKSPGYTRGCAEGKDVSADRFLLLLTQLHVHALLLIAAKRSEAALQRLRSFRVLDFLVAHLLPEEGDCTPAVSSSTRPARVPAASFSSSLLRKSPREPAKDVMRRRLPLRYSSGFSGGMHRTKKQQENRRGSGSLRRLLEGEQDGRLKEGGESDERYEEESAEGYRLSLSGKKKPQVIASKASYEGSSRDGAQQTGNWRHDRLEEEDPLEAQQVETSMEDIGLNCRSSARRSPADPMVSSGPQEALRLCAMEEVSTPGPGPSSAVSSDLSDPSSVVAKDRDIARCLVRSSSWSCSETPRSNTSSLSRGASSKSGGTPLSSSCPSSAGSVRSDSASLFSASSRTDSSSSESPISLTESSARSRSCFSSSPSLALSTYSSSSSFSSSPLSSPCRDFWRRPHTPAMKDHCHATQSAWVPGGCAREGGGLNAEPVDVREGGMPLEEEGGPGGPASSTGKALKSFGDVVEKLTRSRPRALHARSPSGSASPASPQGDRGVEKALEDRSESKYGRERRSREQRREKNGICGESRRRTRQRRRRPGSSGARSKAERPEESPLSGPVPGLAPRAGDATAVSKVRIKPFVPPLRLDALPPPASYRELQQPPSEAAPSYGPTRPPTGKAPSTHRARQSPFLARTGSGRALRMDGKSARQQLSAPANSPCLLLTTENTAEGQGGEQLNACHAKAGRDTDGRCWSAGKRTGRLSQFPADNGRGHAAGCQRTKRDSVATTGTATAAEGAVVVESGFEPCAAMGEPEDPERVMCVSEKGRTVDDRSACREGWACPERDRKAEEGKGGARISPGNNGRLCCPAGDKTHVTLERNADQEDVIRPSSGLFVPALAEKEKEERDGRHIERENISSCHPCREAEGEAASLPEGVTLNKCPGGGDGRLRGTTAWISPGSFSGQRTRGPESPGPASAAGGGNAKENEIQVTCQSVGSVASETIELDRVGWARPYGECWRIRGTSRAEDAATGRLKEDGILVSLPAAGRGRELVAGASAASVCVPVQAASEANAQSPGTSARVPINAEAASCLCISPLLSMSSSGADGDTASTNCADSASGGDLCKPTRAAKPSGQRSSETPAQTMRCLVLARDTAAAWLNQTQAQKPTECRPLWTLVAPRCAGLATAAQQGAPDQSSTALDGDTTSSAIRTDIGFQRLRPGTLQSPPSFKASATGRERRRTSPSALRDARPDPPRGGATERAAYLPSHMAAHLVRRQAGVTLSTSGLAGDGMGERLIQGGRCTGEGTEKDAGNNRPQKWSFIRGASSSTSSLAEVRDSDKKGGGCQAGPKQPDGKAGAVHVHQEPTRRSFSGACSGEEEGSTADSTTAGTTVGGGEGWWWKQEGQRREARPGDGSSCAVTRCSGGVTFSLSPRGSLQGVWSLPASSSVEGPSLPAPAADGASGVRHWKRCSLGTAVVGEENTRGARGTQSASNGSPTGLGSSGQGVVHTAPLAREPADHRDTPLFFRVPAAPPGASSLCYPDQQHHELAKGGTQHVWSVGPDYSDMDGRYTKAAKQGRPFEWSVEQPESARSVTAASQGLYKTQPRRMVAAVKASGCGQTPWYEAEPVLPASALSISGTLPGTGAETRAPESDCLPHEDRNTADAAAVCSAPAVARSSLGVEAGFPILSSKDCRGTCGQRESALRRFEAPYRGNSSHRPLLIENCGFGRPLSVTEDSAVLGAAAAVPPTGRPPVTTPRARETAEPACHSTSCVASSKELHKRESCSAGSSPAYRVSPLTSPSGRALARESSTNHTVPHALQSTDKFFSPSLSSSGRTHGGASCKVAGGTSFSNSLSCGRAFTLPLSRYRSQLDGVNGAYSPGHDVSAQQHFQGGVRTLPTHLVGPARYSWHPHPFEKLCLLAALVTPRLLLQQLKQERSRGPAREGSVGRADKKGARWAAPAVHRRAASRPRFTSEEKLSAAVPSVGSPMRFPASVVTQLGGDNSQQRELKGGSLRCYDSAGAKTRSGTVVQGEPVTCATSDLYGNPLGMVRPGTVCAASSASPLTGCRDCVAFRSSMNEDHAKRLRGHGAECLLPDYALQPKPMARKLTAGLGLQVTSEWTTAGTTSSRELERCPQLGGTFCPTDSVSPEAKLMPADQFGHNPSGCRDTAKGGAESVGKTTSGQKPASPPSYNWNLSPTSGSGEACSPVERLWHLPVVRFPEATAVDARENPSPSEERCGFLASIPRERGAVQVSSFSTAGQKSEEAGRTRWSGPSGGHAGGAVVGQELETDANEVSEHRKEEKEAPSQETADVLRSFSGTGPLAPMPVPSACRRTSGEQALPRPQVPTYSPAGSWRAGQTSAGKGRERAPAGDRSGSEIRSEWHIRTADFPVQMPGDEMLKQSCLLGKKETERERVEDETAENNSCPGASKPSSGARPGSSVHVGIALCSRYFGDSSLVPAKDQGATPAAEELADRSENQIDKGAAGNGSPPTDKCMEEASSPAGVRWSSGLGSEQGVVVGGGLAEEKRKQGVWQVPPLNVAACSGDVAELASRVAPGVVTAWTEIHRAQKQAHEMWRVLERDGESGDDRGNQQSCAGCHGPGGSGQRQSHWESYLSSHNSRLCPPCSLALLGPLVHGAAYAQAELRLCHDSLLHALAISLLVSLLVQGRRGLLSSDVDQDEGLEALISPVPSSASRMCSPPLASPSGSLPSTQAHVATRAPMVRVAVSSKDGTSVERGQTGNQPLIGCPGDVPAPCDREEAINNVALPDARSVKPATELSSEAVNRQTNSYAADGGSVEHEWRAQLDCSSSRGGDSSSSSHLGAAQGSNAVSVVPSSARTPKAVSGFSFARVLPLLQRHLSFFPAPAVSGGVAVLHQNRAGAPMQREPTRRSARTNETVLYDGKKRRDRERRRTTKGRHCPGDRRGRPDEDTESRALKNLSESRHTTRHGEPTRPRKGVAGVISGGTVRHTKDQICEGTESTLTGRRSCTSLPFREVSPDRSRHSRSASPTTSVDRKGVGSVRCMQANGEADALEDDGATVSAEDGHVADVAGQLARAAVCSDSGCSESRELCRSKTERLSVGNGDPFSTPRGNHPSPRQFAYLATGTATLRRRGVRNSPARSLPSPERLEGVSSTVKRGGADAADRRGRRSKEEQRQKKNRKREDAIQKRTDEDKERGWALRRWWEEEKEFMRAVVCLTQRHLGPAGCRLLKLLAAGLFPLTLSKQEEKRGCGMFGSVWKCVTPFQDMPALAMKQVPVPIDEKSHMVLSSMFHEVSCLDALRLTSPLFCELFDFGIANSDGLLTYCINMKLYSTTLGAWRRALVGEMEAFLKFSSRPSSRTQYNENAYKERESLAAREARCVSRTHGGRPEENRSQTPDKRCGDDTRDGGWSPPPVPAKAGETDKEDTWAARAAAEAAGRVFFEKEEEDGGAKTGDRSLFRDCENRKDFSSAAHPCWPDGTCRSVSEGEVDGGGAEISVEGDASAPELERALLPLTLAIFLQIASAVAGLHARGVVHYDLKCDNVLVDLDELVPIPHQELLLPSVSVRTRAEDGTTGREEAVCWSHPDKVVCPSVPRGPVSKSDLLHGRVEGEAFTTVESELVLAEVGTLHMPTVAIADFGEARMLITRRRSERHTARSRGTEVNKSPEMLHLAVVCDDEAEHDIDSAPPPTSGPLTSEARLLHRGRSGVGSDGTMNMTNRAEEVEGSNRSFGGRQSRGRESPEHWKREQPVRRVGYLAEDGRESNECIPARQGSSVDWKTRRSVSQHAEDAHHADTEGRDSGAVGFAGQEEETRECRRPHSVSPPARSTENEVSPQKDSFTCGSASSSSCVSVCPVSFQGLGASPSGGPSSYQESDAMAADIWALGCLFYELLTGEFLFASDPFFFLRLTGRLPLLDDHHKERLWWNPLLIRFLLRMLQRRPEKRPSAAEVAAGAHALLLAVFRELSGATAAEQGESESREELTGHADAAMKRRQDVKACIQGEGNVAEGARSCTSVGAKKKEVVTNGGTVFPGRHDGTNEGNHLSRLDEQLVPDSREGEEAPLSLPRTAHTYSPSLSVPCSYGFYFGLLKPQDKRRDKLVGKRNSPDDGALTPSLSRSFPSQERSAAARGTRRKRSGTFWSKKETSQRRQRTEFSCREPRSAPLSSPVIEDCRETVLAPAARSPCHSVHGNEGETAHEAGGGGDTDSSDNASGSVFFRSPCRCDLVSPFFIPCRLAPSYAVPFRAAMTQPLLRDVEVYVVNPRYQGESVVSCSAPFPSLSQCSRTSLCLPCCSCLLSSAGEPSVGGHWPRLSCLSRHDHSFPSKRFSFIVDCRLPRLGWADSPAKRRRVAQIASYPALLGEFGRGMVGASSAGDKRVLARGSVNHKGEGKGIEWGNHNSLRSGAFLLPEGGVLECTGSRVLSYAAFSAAFAADLVGARKSQNMLGEAPCRRAGGMVERRRECIEGQAVENEERRAGRAQKNQSTINSASKPPARRLQLAKNEPDQENPLQGKTREKAEAEVTRAKGLNGPSSGVRAEARVHDTDKPEDQKARFCRVSGPDSILTFHGNEFGREPWVSSLDPANPVEPRTPMAFHLEGNPEKSNLEGRVFSRFLPVLFDFLREAAARGASVLLLDEEMPTSGHPCAFSRHMEPSSRGRSAVGPTCTEILGQSVTLVDSSAVRTPPVASGVSTACAAALVMIALGLDPFRAVSLLSSQCSLVTPMSAAVRRVLSSVFHSRRRSRCIGRTLGGEGMSEKHEEMRKKSEGAARFLPTSTCAASPVGSELAGNETGPAKTREKDTAETSSAWRLRDCALEQMETDGEGVLSRGLLSVEDCTASLRRERNERGVTSSGLGVEHLPEAAPGYVEDDEESTVGTRQPSVRLSCPCGACVWFLPQAGCSAEDRVCTSIRLRDQMTGGGCFREGVIKKTSKDLRGRGADLRTEALSYSLSEPAARPLFENILGDSVMIPPVSVARDEEAVSRRQCKAVVETVEKEEKLQQAAVVERMATFVDLLPALDNFLYQEAATCLCEMFAYHASKVPEGGSSQPLRKDAFGSLPRSAEHEAADRSALCFLQQTHHSAPAVPQATSEALYSSPDPECDTSCAWPFFAFGSARSTDLSHSEYCDRAGPSDREEALGLLPPLAGNPHGRASIFTGVSAGDGAELCSANSTCMPCPLQNLCGTYVAALGQRYGLFCRVPARRMTWRLFSFTIPPEPSQARHGVEGASQEKEEEQAEEEPRHPDDIIAAFLGLLAGGSAGGAGASDSGLGDLTAGPTTNSEEVSILELLRSSTNLSFCFSENGAAPSSFRSVPCGEFQSSPPVPHSQPSVQFAGEHPCARAQATPAPNSQTHPESQAGDGETVESVHATRGTGTGAGVLRPETGAERRRGGDADKAQQVALNGTVQNAPSARRAKTPGDNGREETKTEKNRWAHEAKSESESFPFAEPKRTNCGHKAAESRIKPEWRRGVNERAESKVVETKEGTNGKVRGQNLNGNTPSQSGPCRSWRGIGVTGEPCSHVSDVEVEGEGRAQKVTYAARGQARRGSESEEPESEDFRGPTCAAQGSSNCARQILRPPWRLFRCRICRVLTHAVAVWRKEEAGHDALRNPARCPAEPGDVFPSDLSEKVFPPGLGKCCAHSPRGGSCEVNHVGLKTVSFEGTAIAEKPPVLRSSSRYSRRLSGSTAVARAVAEAAPEESSAFAYSSTRDESSKRDEGGFSSSRVMVAFPSFSFRQRSKTQKPTADSGSRASPKSEAECGFICRTRWREQHSDLKEEDSGADAEEEGDWDGSKDGFVVGRRPVLSELSLGDVLFAQS